VRLQEGDQCRGVGLVEGRGAEREHSGPVLSRAPSLAAASG
jgi:hypothetical protein